MIKYKDFEYQWVLGTKWQVVYPTGFKTTILADNESIVKDKIDDYVEFSRNYGVSDGRS